MIGMLLSQEEIRERMRKEEIVLTPFEPTRFKEGSYSFAIGKRVSRLSGEGEIVTGQPMPHEDVEMPDDGYVLAPGAFAIFYTEERVTLSAHILCLLSTRGSIARLGLDMIQSSLIVEPGTDSVLALETYNHGPRPVRIVSHVPMVKGIFFELNGS